MTPSEFLTAACPHFVASLDASESAWRNVPPTLQPMAASAIAALFLACQENLGQDVTEAEEALKKLVRESMGKKAP